MFGAKQIMFGTDIPLREDIELQRRDIEALNLTAAELDDIYACNAARLLGISLSSGT
jgi:predicted TIM-barrel fold metal-dependent hydrolase